MSKADADKCRQIAESIKQMMDRPNSAPQTSYQMKVRANNLRSIASGIKAAGGSVKPEYE